MASPKDASGATAASADHCAGQIITFYSYKGGTGRTMALANVACLLANQRIVDIPRPVLMIDWDLEAPGLHRYFREHLPPDSAKRKGLIDLFEFLRQEISTKKPTSDEETEDFVEQLVDTVDLSQFITPTSIGQLSLMQAGLFDAHYASRVNRFDWEELFNLAPTLITALAERLARDYSFVLVDSRTGHTDIKDICTTLLPDKLVLVFTPNQQSIRGAIEVGRAALAYRMKSDDLRALGVFPLTSRVDASLDDLRELWRRGDDAREIPGFQTSFEEFFVNAYQPPRLTKKASATGAGRDERTKLALETYFNKVLIKHDPELSYGEPIATLRKGTDRFSTARSYLDFAELLVKTPGPWDDSAAGNEDLTRRVLAHESEVRSTEAKTQYARTVNQGFVWFMLSLTALAVVLGVGFALYRSASDNQTLVKQVQDKELNLKLIAEQGAYLSFRLNKDQDLYRFLAELLGQVEQASTALDSLEQFSFPARAMAKNPTDETKTQCQTALDEFQNLKSAIESREADLQRALSTMSEEKGIPNCEGEICRKTQASLKVMVARAMGDLREQTQILLPGLRAEQEFWAAQLESWKKTPSSEGSARSQAMKLWEQGYTTYLQGDHEGARKLYMDSKAADPSYAPPYNSLAVLEIAKGSLQPALGWLDEALARDNTYAPAYSNRALIYLRLATNLEAGSETWKTQLSRAEEASKAALRIRPDTNALDVQTKVKQLRAASAETQQLEQKPLAPRAPAPQPVAPAPRGAPYPAPRSAPIDLKDMK